MQTDVKQKIGQEVLYSCTPLGKWLMKCTLLQDILSQHKPLIAFYVIWYGIFFMAICGAKLTKDVDICNCVQLSTFLALTISTGVDNFQKWFSQNILGPIPVSRLYGKQNSDGRIGLSKTHEVMGMFDNVAFSRRM